MSHLRQQIQHRLFCFLRQITLQLEFHIKAMTPRERGKFAFANEFTSAILQTMKWPSLPQALVLVGAAIKQKRSI
jgi:hypothetical protein